MERINSDKHLEKAVRIAGHLQKYSNYGNANPYTALDSVRMALKAGVPEDDIRIRTVVGIYLEQDGLLVREYERLNPLWPQTEAHQKIRSVIRRLREELSSPQ